MGGREQRPLDGVLAELAARQHGVVARRQLLELGLGRGAIELRLARGRLHGVHHGVYAVGHRLLGDRGHWMAALLAGGPGAALSHRSAAALFGVLPWGGPAEVTTKGQRGSRPRVRFHCSRLPEDEVVSEQGIRVTSVARTVLDLAARLPSRQLRRVLEEAEYRRLGDALSVSDLLNRYPGRRGSARLRPILADMALGGQITRSELEERFLAFLERFGLPRPAVNAWLQVGGTWLEADFVWRDRQVIAELDGYAAHGTRSAFERDRGRDRALTVAGWRVVRVTWRQLHAHERALATDLLRLLARPRG